MRRPLILAALVLLAVTSIPPWTAPLSAAITVAEKLVAHDSAASSAYTMTAAGGAVVDAGADAFEVAAGSILLCFTEHSDGDAAEAVSAMTHGATGLTSITSRAYEATINMASAWWAAGPLASGSIVISTSGDAQTGMGVACYELPGADTSTPVIQSKTANTTSGTSHPTTLDVARTANSAIFHWGATGTATSFSGSDLATLGTSNAYTSPANRGRVAYSIADSDAEPTWTTANTANVGLIAVEIAIAASAATSAPKCLLLGACE